MLSVGWLGSAYCMLVLGLTGALATAPSFGIAAYQLMHVFDRAVNIPLTLGMLGTGLVVSLRTRWGLLRYRWVVVKLVTSVATMVVVPLLSVPRVTEAAERLRTGQDPGNLPAQIVLISVIVVGTLTAVTAVSVVKPWGRTRWAVPGRRGRAGPARE